MDIGSNTHPFFHNLYQPTILGNCGHKTFCNASLTDSMPLIQLIFLQSIPYFFCQFTLVPVANATASVMYGDNAWMPSN